MASVEMKEVGPPPANVQFEQPEGPFVVGDPAADVSKSTGLHERNPGDEVVGTDMHDQTPTGAFEQPGPQVVALDGFDVAKPKPKPQKKVVTPPTDGESSSTSGAETK